MFRYGFSWDLRTYRRDSSHKFVWRKEKICTYSQVLCSLERLGERFDRWLQQLCYSLSRLLCRKSDCRMVNWYLITACLFNGSPRITGATGIWHSTHQSHRHFALSTANTSFGLWNSKQTNRGRAVVAKAATSGDMAPWRVLCDGQWRVSVRRFLRLLLYRTATDIYQKNLNSTEESFALWPNFFINTFHSCVYKLGEWTSIQHYFYSVYWSPLENNWLTVLSVIQ